MVFIDLLLVLVIFIYLYSKKEISFLNPSFLFLIFHFFFVSVRAFQILLFDAKIIANYWYSDFVSVNEIEKALIVSDITLLGFILGFNLLKKSFVLKGKKLNIFFSTYKDKKPKKIKFFEILALILGIIGTFGYTILPGKINDIDTIETNIFVTLITSFGVISALMLIYLRGFKKIYLLYLFVILIIFSIQGYHRYKVVLPLLFLMSYYLKLNNLKLPPLKYIMIGAFIFVFSFPLKQIGRSIQQNEQIDLVEIGLNSFNNLVEGESGDLSFLEQSAAMIGTMDKRQKVFYGETYVPILFFWVPRLYWKDKPKLNEWQHEISTAGRDYGQFGQISLLSGESYANFRFLGAFLIPFLVGRFYSKIYYSFKDINYRHRGFLTLMLLNMILFQVWRDGIISLIIFPLINYLPLVLLILIKKPEKKFK